MHLRHCEHAAFPASDWDVGSSLYFSHGPDRLALAPFLAHSLFYLLPTLAINTTRSFSMVPQILKSMQTEVPWPVFLLEELKESLSLFFLFMIYPSSLFSAHLF